MEYTDREIYDMLLPKLKTNFPDLDWGEQNEATDAFPNLVKMLALVYRIGCGQEEKEEETAKWTVVDREPRKGDYVIMKSERLHEHNSEFYPIVGTMGEVYECENYGGCCVQWPKGTTSGDDVWWISANHLEVVKWK